MLSPADVQKFRLFIQACDADPAVLHLPELGFFRDFLIKMGATLPEKPASAAGDSSASAPPPEAAPKPDSSPEPEPEPEEPEEPESEESDLDLDNSGVLEPESDDPQPMGDSDKEVSEEDMEAASERRGQAAAAFSEGEFEKAVQLYTEAIELNPGSALFHAKRAACYLKIKKPMSAVRDCDKAIQINPDSASAYKFRGRANRLLGHWEAAAADLRTACRLDFDEQADEWLREVTPNAKKIAEHNRKYQRRREERELKQKQERVRRARAEQEKARARAAAGAGEQGPTAGGMPGGFPGMPGAMPEGLGGMGELLKDPEIMAAMQDPEVMAAFADVSKNPANIMKYQNNPKVMALITKMTAKLGGGGGGGMPGGMPGFPGGAGGFPGGMGGFPGGMGGFPGGMGGGSPGDNVPPRPSGPPDMDVD